MMTREDAQGLMFSVAAHALLAVLFFLTTLDPPLQRPEFIELSLGTVTTERDAPSSVSGHEAPSRNLPGVADMPRRRALDLPERKLNSGDDVFRAAAAKKLDVDDRPRGVEADRKPERRSEPALRSSQIDSRKVAIAEVERAELARPGASGTAGTETGTAVSYAMQWTGGGTRKKISGALPVYPRGTNIEAQIKIEAVVFPDGTIRSMKPAQKGNTRLEEAAMKEVRLWRFEPLRPSVPKQNQTCTISFDFRLK